MSQATRYSGAGDKPPKYLGTLLDTEELQVPTISVSFICAVGESHSALVRDCWAESGLPAVCLCASGQAQLQEVAQLLPTLHDTL